MKTRALALTLAAATLSTGCSKHVYRSADDWTPVAPADRQIDALVADAFAAAPQLPSPARVAVYSVDPERSDAVVEAIAALDGIAGVFAVPDALVDGDRGAPDLSQLRVLAAQARCDLLLVADYGWSVETRANGLVALNALLVPALFTPFLRVQVDSYLDSAVIDVRNGYLYGAVSARQSGEDGFATLYQIEEPALVDAQLEPLLEETREGLAELLEPGAAIDAP